MGEEGDTGGTKMGDPATTTATTTTVAGAPIVDSTSNNASDSSTSSSHHKSEVFHQAMATIGPWGEVGRKRDASLSMP